jgi:Tn3 transposase DDE domain
LEGRSDLPPSRRLRAEEVLCLIADDLAALEQCANVCERRIMAEEEVPMPEKIISLSDPDGLRAGDVWVQVNARYGSGPGVTFYTHISDRYAPFHTKVINATVRDATHVLDGLLYHESDLRIEEHYTDTGGFTDHVFGLCHLLGFRFAPAFVISPTGGCTPPKKPSAIRRFSRLSEARSTSNNSWPSGQRSYGLVAPSVWAR